MHPWEKLAWLLFFEMSNVRTYHIRLFLIHIKHYNCNIARKYNVQMKTRSSSDQRNAAIGAIIPTTM